jgi:hypothetical protein
VGYLSSDNPTVRVGVAVCGLIRAPVLSINCRVGANLTRPVAATKSQEGLTDSCLAGATGHSVGHLGRDDPTITVGNSAHDAS